MKLLAQFYACLAIIVFIAVIGGSEARSSGFTAAVNHRGLMSEQDPAKENLNHAAEPSGESLRLRRHAHDEEEIPEKDPITLVSPPRSRRSPHDEEDVPKEQIQQTPKRNRRHATHDQEHPQADEGDVPEKQLKRNRRQMPGGNMPDPKDMAKQVPMPGGR